MITFGFFDILFFCIPFLIIFGILFRYQSKRYTVDEYFHAEGNLSWFVAGTAMVATTFAADTPLAVTEIVREHGISGNWLWWYMAIGGFVTVFIFAKLWKRSGVKTDLEFIHIRYSGLGAKILRGFKAVFVGLFLNLIVMSWVNLALLKILPVFFPDYSAVTILACLLVFGVVYTAFAGLRGISYVDVFQFFLAWLGCLAYAYFALSIPEVGGLSALKDKLPKETFSFFPTKEKGGIPWDHFLIFLSVLWWSSWYPGSEPGGGGYIAQRILATKNESSAIKSSLLFVVAHYFVRPWPWILVALVSLVLFPNLTLEESGAGFLKVLHFPLPPGLVGLLLSSFLAAYLSTIATHLNWGTSYLIQDFFRPYIWKDRSDREYIYLSYGIQFLLTGVSLYFAIYGLDTIREFWIFLLEASSGIGFILIVRWFYWRISAWTEVLSLVLSPVLYYLVRFKFQLEFPYTIVSTALCSAVILILLSFFLPGTDPKVLRSFYEKTKPPYFFWKGLYSKESMPIYNNHLLLSLLCICSGLLVIFSGLYLIQSLLWWTDDVIYSLLGFICFSFLFFVLVKVGTKYEVGVETTVGFGPK